MSRAIALEPDRSRRAAARRLAALALVSSLAGCGGGIFVGFDFSDDDFGVPPSISLAVSPSAAPSGAVVQLVAAASDPGGIDSVAFYQLDDDGTALLLGADGTQPYQWNATVPAATASGSVRYFARATDGFGRRADSGVVTVVITP